MNLRDCRKTRGWIGYDRVWLGCLTDEQKIAYPGGTAFALSVAGSGSSASRTGSEHLKLRGAGAAHVLKASGLALAVTPL